MRPLSAEMINAMQQPVIRPVLLMQGAFKTGTVRFWTGVGPLIWNAQQFTGAGDLISVSQIEETDDVKANGIEITLSAVKTETIALGLLEMQRALPGYLWFGLVQEDGRTLIPDPMILFRGRLDTVRIQDSLGGAALVLTYENELIDLERPRELRYTAQEQRRLYPGDSFLDFVSGLQDQALRWGSTS